MELRIAADGVVPEWTRWAPVENESVHEERLGVRTQVPGTLTNVAAAAIMSGLHCGMTEPVACCRSTCEGQSRPSTPRKSMDNPDLIRIIRDQYALDWNGVHGVGHWSRVRENGLRLAEKTGARTEVVDLFAFLHDSRRLNDDYDPDHGARAALFAASLAGSVFHLPPEDLDLLLEACRRHSDGLMVGDITVLTCWDADRLDLGRVGIKPRPNRLCTFAARDPAVMQWAYGRSIWHASG
jgi:uncharacterized protein